MHTNASKTRNMNVKIICEIFYVVSVRISGEILDDQKLWDDTDMIEIKVTFFLFSSKNPIKAVKC